MSDHLPAPEEVEAARQQSIRERAVLRAKGIYIRPDELELGLKLANAISAAVYKPRGELRERKR